MREITSEEMLEDNFSIEDIIEEDWKSIFRDKDIMLVQGEAGRWNGKSKMNPTLIFGTEVEDFMRMINIESLSFKIFKNYIEISNTHHDGTNNYTVRPFSYNMLTKGELGRIIERNYDSNEVATYYKIKPSKVTKEYLVDFCETMEINLLQDTVIGRK